MLSLQVPPNKIIKEVALPDKWKKSVQVMAFAKYFDPAGQYPLNLTSFKHAYILLDRQSIEFGELKP